MPSLAKAEKVLGSGIWVAGIRRILCRGRHGSRKDDDPNFGQAKQPQVHNLQDIKKSVCQVVCRSDMCQYPHCNDVM